MEKLDGRQSLPLTSAELDTVRELAQQRGLSAGLLSRALIRYALVNLDDPGLSTTIDEEIQQAHDRASVAGRTAAGHRWAGH